MDLTKKRYSIFTEAMQLEKNNEAVKFVMAEINCYLKAVFKNFFFFLNIPSELFVLQKLCFLYFDTLHFII